MNTAKTLQIGAFSAIISFLTAFLIYRGLENFSGIVHVFAIIACGLMIGACQGFLIERPSHNAIGIGTFVGTLILWSPVVVVTYGFALAAVPFLAAFAVLVSCGAKLGCNLRERAGRSA